MCFKNHAHLTGHRRKQSDRGEDAYLSHRANKGQSRDLNPGLCDSWIYGFSSLDQLRVLWGLLWNGVHESSGSSQDVGDITQLSETGWVLTYYFVTHFTFLNEINITHLPGGSTETWMLFDLLIRCDWMATFLVFIFTSTLTALTLKILLNDIKRSLLGLG